MDLNKFDTIQLTHDEVSNLFEWRNNNTDYVRKFKMFLNEGIITILLDASKKYKLSIYFKLISTNIIHFEFYAVQPQEILKQINFNIKFNTDGYYSVLNHEIISSKIECTKLEEMIEDSVSIFSTTMAYVTYFEQEFIESKEVIPYKEKRLKKLQRIAKYNPNHKIRFNKFIYKMNPNTKYKNVSKKMYEKHIDAWSVRGHWRQIKNKRIWIKPYQKGKGKVNPKVYDITGI